MDYEKKYKEAIEKLRNFYRDYDTVSCIIDVKEELANLFPELKESEGEKARKSLIILLQYFCKGYRVPGLDFPVSYKDMLAWLEKQGEPTDINPSEFDLRLNKLLKQFETLSKEELASSLSFYLNVVQNDGTYKAEEKQGEQKPAKNIVEIWKDMRLEVYQQASGNRHEPNYSDDTTKMFSLNDIDEIIEKMSEQKPADWSEEDEDIRDTIIRDLKRLGGDIVNVKPAYKEEVDWLKSLKQRIGE